MECVLPLMLSLPCKIDSPANTPPKPDLPTQEYVREHGYPVNESGETYGPNVEGFDAPDLILAHPQGKLQGYLKESEDPHWSVSHVLSGLRI